jgi:UDP-glucose 4-epimerase
MAERTVLVTGATGALGPSVVRACQAAGYCVRALSIDAPEVGVLPPDVDVRIGDICDGHAVRQAVSGVDAVVHLAALLHQFGDAAALEEQYERINVGGTENVVRAAEAEGVKRAVLLSTIAVYGPSSRQIVDERTPPRPDTPYGRTKLAAERAVLAATSRGRPIGTVLRSAAAYGSRVKGNYRRLAVAIARRRFVPLGAGANRRTLVHDHDLARAVVLACEHPAAAGAVFNVSDGAVHTLAEIIAAIHRAIGRRPPRLRVPLAVVRAALTTIESASRVAGIRPPVSKALLEKYSEDIAVDATLIQRELGFAPEIDLDRGWRETMADLRDAGAW